MPAPRRTWRRGDGSAAVRGWVAGYTFGLPADLRARRRDEVTADLADESVDAVRRGQQQLLFRRRMTRLARGIPDDLTWRLIDAPRIARRHRVPTAWVPLTRWSMALIAIVGTIAAGGLGIVTAPMLLGDARPDAWTGLGPVGFAIASAAVVVGVGLSIPWPRRGAALMVPGALLGFLVAPWLWGEWALALVAVAVRAYQGRDPDTARPIDLVVRRR